MRAVRFRAAIVPAVLIAAALALVAAGPGSPAGASTSARAGDAASAAPAAASGCHKEFQPPDSWVVVCTAGGGTGGGGGGGTGGGGGGGKYTCTLKKLSPADIADQGLAPAPKGEQWDAIVCPGNAPFGGVTLVNTNPGAPPVTPEELLQVAESELTVPVLTPQTAPALNRKGLVGLPEWFWVPRNNWRPIHVVVQVGPVWARLWATPETTSFDPGGGLAGASCDGPGTPYSATATAASGCTFTYDQSSDTQEGGAYAAAVTVHWLVQWAGSDGTHQVLNNDLAVAFPFALRVAEGQALVTGSGQ